ncbi:MAG: hypothetical protein LUG85_03200 [Clostridiales bacterium]|nr:hypothetical protein [Clostridiales bacterium]
MKTNLKKILSIVLSALMLCGIFTVTGFAADDAITVSFSAYDGSVLMPKQTLTVTDGIAEEYGYEIPETDHNGETVDGITALDVLVAAHTEYYGDDFTAETASDYLVIKQGQILLAFGKSAYASSFAVNNDCPHDDNFNESWASYTGYGIDEAVIEDGDYMAYFFYQDTKYYSDDYAWFTVDGESVTETYTKVNTAVTLTLEGYCYGWYSCSKDEDKGITALAGVDVYLYSDGEYTLLGQTDENGQITVELDTKGDFMICAYGTTVDSYGYSTPVSAAWMDISAVSGARYLWNKIVEFFTAIFAAIAALFS